MFRKHFFGYIILTYTSEEKILGANHVRYNTKTLGKVIMKRSNLQTKCSKTRTPKPLKKKCKKQKNYCNRLY